MLSSASLQHWKSKLGSKEENLRNFFHDAAQNSASHETHDEYEIHTPYASTSAANLQAENVVFKFVSNMKTNT